MKTKIKELTKVYISDYRHWISTAITIIFLLFSIFIFKYAGLRIIESLIDIKNSCITYVSELFEIPMEVNNTINEFTNQPFEMPFELPSTWEEFKSLWSNYWDVFFSKETFAYYIKWLSEVLYYVSKILVILLPIVILLVVIFNTAQSNINNNYNEDTKCLTYWKEKIDQKIYLPIKDWIGEYIIFLKENSIYTKIWVLIWAYNFNVITIIIEALAYYLYFAATFDLISLYRQFLKLLMDLSVPVDFIPFIGWIIIGYLVIDLIRRNIGYMRLNHMEMRNRGFINERAIVILDCGTMNKKKTTMITDMALSQEIMFRDKALELILECDLKFPYFPWINLENALKSAMKRHRVYNLATTKKFINILKLYYEFQYKDDIVTFKSIKRYIKRYYGIYPGENCIFDYDYERYGLYYDNKLDVTYIWDVIKDYAQLYFVYVIQSSLIISNYSIRTDNVLEDLGNLPMWNTDLFKRDSRYLEAYSRHAHIIDFDALRLGKTLIKNNAKSNVFEFGVFNFTEFGKERQNSLELQGVKKTDDVANQKNDLFNYTLKMGRHLGATICNYPFIRFIGDEQRPESLGADARDLCEIIHIEECSEMRLAMPLFALGDLIIRWFLSKFNSSYTKYRFERGDNTLGMHLYHGLSSKCNKYHKGIYNTFGYYKLNILVENGTQDGKIKRCKYYLMFKKIYSKRFSTDCFSDYFAEKTYRSKLGLNDVEEYKTEKATFDEMLQQNSYFFNDLHKLRKGK